MADEDTKSVPIGYVQVRVVQYDGFCGLTRLEMFSGWSKKLERTCNFANFVQILHATTHL